MSSQAVRFVNVVPNIKIKKEVISDEDEDCVACRICSKTFASEMALGNHARLEHTEVFSTGDKSQWTKPVEVEEPCQEDEKSIIQQKTQQLISSMAPTSLMSLASEDVSYIIIKSETMDPRERKRRGDGEKKRKGDKDGTKVTPRREKDKEPQPITGPFECLEPSTLVADGVCHQIFFSCCEYSAHFRDEHTRRRKGLRCQVCEKPLFGAGEEPTHPYPCEVCGAGFQTNKELSAHMATDHVKLKPFQCSVCNKRFTQQGGVQQHMRMHTGDRPFPCTICNKAFTQKSGLDQHLRIHTKVRPYRCVICSKTFCQSIHLKQHMRTHTNVSPFQCGICAKRFKQSSHLNYHLKNHNPMTMSDDQKDIYYKLMSMMKSPEKDDGMRMSIDPRGNVQVVEIDEELQETVVTMDEDQVIEDEEEIEVPIDEEQIIAEQSIQVEEMEEEDTYILSDSGTEVWSVKLVEG